VRVRKVPSNLDRDRYGDFYLTKAVRPAAELPIIPREGYRVETYCEAGFRVPLLAAAVSRERLFDTFLELLEPLGPVVDVVLETSHSSSTGEHLDLYRAGIDRPVLLSYLYDYEELLTDDGCTGIAVLDEESGMEVQFDEHKLLMVYAYDLRPFIAVLEGQNVRRDDTLRLITEARHLHCTQARYFAAFEQLCLRLGLGEPAEQIQW
jgi:hypothetical protein